MKINFSIYRFNPFISDKPYMQDYSFSIDTKNDLMLLDALIYLRENYDMSLSFRRSCREGICGSDGMNINGRNGLACITPISSLLKKHKRIIIRPLPGLPVIRDLIVDMEQFYAQYKKVEPYLISNQNRNLKKENIQYPDQRKKLDGLYECILCGCCSASCPSFWWNPDKFIGPAGLIASYRFIVDNRDINRNKRLNKLNDSFSVLRCHSIMNCVTVCPKGLNPTEAIHNIKRMMLKL